MNRVPCYRTRVVHPPLVNSHFHLCDMQASSPKISFFGLRGFSKSRRASLIVSTYWAFLPSLQAAAGCLGTLRCQVAEAAAQTAWRHASWLMSESSVQGILSGIWTRWRMWELLKRYSRGRNSKRLRTMETHAQSTECLPLSLCLSLSFSLCYCSCYPKDTMCPYFTYYVYSSCVKSNLAHNHHPQQA